MSRTAQAIALMDRYTDFDLRTRANFAALEMGLQAHGVYVAYLTKHPELNVRCKACNQVLRGNK